MPPAVGQFSQDAGGCSFEYRAILSAWIVKSWSVAFAGNVGGSSLIHNGGGGRSDATDVLQSEAPRTAIVGNIEDVEEEAGACAIEAGTLPCDGEVLAREPGSDAIHLAAPLSASEGEQVRPDRRRIKCSRFHKRDKLRGSSGFPLHVANGSHADAVKVECGAEPFAEHSDAGAQFDGM
jgi:hypothetical protein